MRDSVYEVKSPRVTVQYRCTLNFDKVFKQFFYECLLVEIAMTSEDMMVASEHCQRLGHSQKLCEIMRPFLGSSVQFVHEFLLFESAMTSEDIMVASLNLFVG